MHEVQGSNPEIMHLFSKCFIRACTRIDRLIPTCLSIYSVSASIYVVYLLEFMVYLWEFTVYLWEFTVYLWEFTALRRHCDVAVNTATSQWRLAGVLIVVSVSYLHILVYISIYHHILVYVIIYHSLLVYQDIYADIPGIYQHIPGIYQCIFPCYVIWLARLHALSYGRIL